MDSRTQRASGTDIDPRVDPRVDARVGLAMWLRAGRTQRNLSLEDVAKVTKIQPRILEKLESGQFDGLPADVFVKGFVRSFAKCVGLPELEAIERYGAAQSGQATAIARALVDTMSPTVRLVEPKTLSTQPSEPAVDGMNGSMIDSTLAPIVAETASVQIVEVVHVVELAPIAAPVAPVEVVHVADLAPIGTPVVEIAAALTASLEPSEPATAKKKRTRKKSTTAAPKVSAASTDSASMDIASTEVASTEVASTEAASTTVAAKAPRSRKKKTTVTPVVAAPVTETAAVTETTAQTATADAPATLSSDVAIDAGTNLDATADALPETTKFVRVDAPSEGELSTTADATAHADLAELHEAASFAMSLTSEYELEVSVEDSSDDLQLAAGSQLISASSIASLGSAEARSGAEGRRGESIEVEDRTSGTWQPTMPAMASTPSAPWRRPQLPTQNAYVVPSLVIDDADPDSADREREVRASSKDHSRLSFLPPILLDREDRSARQGGLTLAVIILLIAATLTLSYLMRRPSPSGDGVTLLDGQTQLYS
jgi:hypothetical protein